METKPAFASRTLAFNALMLILGLIFRANDVDVIRQHPEETLALLTVGNMLLRLITRQKLTLFPPASADPPHPNLF